MRDLLLSTFPALRRTLPRARPVQTDAIDPACRILKATYLRPLLEGTGHRLVGGVFSEGQRTNGEGEGADNLISMSRIEPVEAGLGWFEGFGCAGNSDRTAIAHDRPNNSQTTPPVLPRCALIERVIGPNA